MKITFPYQTRPLALVALLIGTTPLFGGEITLDPAAVQNLQLRFSPAELRTVTKPVLAPGSVHLNGKKVFVITPKIDGTITADPHSLGDKVKKGDVLAQIQSADLAGMIANYVAAEEAMQFAVAAAAQEKKLADQNLSSTEQLREANMRLTEAITAHARALQPLKLLEFNEGTIHQFLSNVDGADYTSLEITAPEAGEIIEKDLRRGAAVDHDHSLFTIADLSELWVDFQVALRDAPNLSIGDEIRVESSVTTKERDAEIIYIAPIADERSRTVMARALLENPDRKWRPGTPVFVSVTAGKNAESALTVPTGAIVDFEGGKAVFVKQGENVFLPVPVEPGVSDGSFTSILSGLQAGQTVVSQNAAQLKGHLEMTASE